MNILTQLRRIVYKIQDLFPTRLPVGLTDFNQWCDRLLFTYFPENVQPPSEDSFRFSVAAMILHIDSQKAKVPNRFFGRAIQKGASNEVASFVMQDLKAKRDALIKEQEQALARKTQQKVAEATAELAKADCGPQEQRVS